MRLQRAFKCRQRRRLVTRVQALWRGHAERTFGRHQWLRRRHAMRKMQATFTVKACVKRYLRRRMVRKAKEAEKAAAALGVIAHLVLMWVARKQREKKKQIEREMKIAMREAGKKPKISAFQKKEIAAKAKARVYATCEEEAGQGSQH